LSTKYKLAWVNNFHSHKLFEKEELWNTLKHGIFDGERLFKLTANKNLTTFTFQK